MPQYHIGIPSTDHISKGTMVFSLAGMNRGSLLIALATFIILLLMTPHTYVIAGDPCPGQGSTDPHCQNPPKSP
ncbi:unnamed protein product [Urochloa humidicola]